LDSATRAIGLLRRERGRTLTVLTGPEAIVDADAAEIPVGIDGEAVSVATPVHCTIRPRALRVRLPRERPGVPAPATRIQWDRLWRLAAGRSRDPAHAG
jgi:hypothetical protein